MDKVRGSASPLLRETALLMLPGDGAGLGDPDLLFCLDQDGKSGFRDLGHHPGQTSWPKRAWLAITDIQELEPSEKKQ